MFQIRLARFLCPSLTLCPSVLGHVGSFRKYEHPHGHQLAQSCHGIPLLPLKFVQSMFESWFILCPFSREKYEAEEQHAGSEEWNIFEFVFKDDKEVACHIVGVGHPPEVKPVGVDLKPALVKRLQMSCDSTHLVICEDQYSFWKMCLESSIRSLPELSAHALVTGDYDGGRTPPLLYYDHQNAKVLLQKSLPGVIPIFVPEV